MNIFRNHTPKRRNITKIVNTHGEHRKDLKADYKDRCGYCNDLDNWRFIWFEIDHFIPKIRNKKPFLTIKTITDYSNLVYSCRSCNNAKRNKWPSNDETIAIVDNKGFIDPCDDEYNNQFNRLNSGRITPKTDLGDWMYKAMKLYKPQHEILWNIEQLYDLILEIRKLIEISPNEDIDLMKRLISLYNTYDNYIQKLFKH